MDHHAADSCEGSGDDGAPGALPPPFLTPGAPAALVAQVATLTAEVARLRAELAAATAVAAAASRTARAKNEEGEALRALLTISTSKLASPADASVAANPNARRLRDWFLSGRLQLSSRALVCTADPLSIASAPTEASQTLMLHNAAAAGNVAVLRVLLETIRFPVDARDTVSGGVPAAVRVDAACAPGRRCLLLPPASSFADGPHRAAPPALHAAAVAGGDGADAAGRGGRPHTL
jgi:hypothetical protein